MTAIDMMRITIRDIDGFLKIRLALGETRYMNERTGAGIILVERGSVVYEHKGKRFLSDPNHLLVMPRGITYHFACTEESVNYVVNIVIDDIPDFDDIISVSIAGNLSFIKSVARLEVLWTFRKTGYWPRCMAGLYDIFAKITDIENAPYAPDSQFEQIRPSIDYLESNWADPELTNDAAAAQSGVSTVYFRRLFTNKYGVSPMRYVKLRRIEKAQELLLGQYMSVTGVSKVVGFNSIYHFCRAFKSATGYTPTEYLRLKEKNL